MGSVNSSATRPKAAGVAMASPIPCRKRLATSMAESTAAPLRAEAMANTVTPMRNIRLRPRRSANRPPRRRSPPAVRTYPSTTQARPARLKSRLVSMRGRATFTTVISSTMMNWTRAMTARAAHRLLCC